MLAESYRRYNKDERLSSLEKYTSHFIWKGCVWEGLGDRTELHHIDPHSIGHNSVSFPFSWAAQPGVWGPSLSGGWFSLLLLISNWSDLQLTDFLSSPGLYNNLASALLPTSVTISHSFNPSTVKVIISWYSSTGCTCYLHRCISYFDSLARSEVNMQHVHCYQFQAGVRGVIVIVVGNEPGDPSSNPRGEWLHIANILGMVVNPISSSEHLVNSRAAKSR